MHLIQIARPFDDFVIDITLAIAGRNEDGARNDAVRMSVVTAKDPDLLDQAILLGGRIARSGFRAPLQTRSKLCISSDA